MSNNNEESVRALDEYYTAVREKIKRSGFSISYEETEREVQREAIKEINQLVSQNPRLLEEYRTTFPQQSDWVDTVIRRLDKYEKKKEKS